MFHNVDAGYCYLVKRNRVFMLYNRIIILQSMINGKRYLMCSLLSRNNKCLQHIVYLFLMQGNVQIGKPLFGMCCLHVGIA